MLLFVDQGTAYSYTRRIYKIRKTTIMMIMRIGCAGVWSSWFGGVLFNIVMIA
jgi:hypothetical protein